MLEKEYSEFLEMFLDSKKFSNVIDHAVFFVKIVIFDLDFDCKPFLWFPFLLRKFIKINGFSSYIKIEYLKYLPRPVLWYKRTSWRINSIDTFFMT